MENIERIGPAPQLRAGHDRRLHHDDGESRPARSRADFQDLKSDASASVRGDGHAASARSRPRRNWTRAAQPGHDEHDTKRPSFHSASRWPRFL